MGKEKTASEEIPELTDGFNLLIDALKLNDLNTIYGVPGIPITDFGRMAQASGIRVLSFRHEQNAGYAAAIAGFLTKKPGICLTVSAPGFLNGLTALALDPLQDEALVVVAEGWEQQGDIERAVEWYERYYETLPDAASEQRRALEEYIEALRRQW